MCQQKKSLTHWISSLQKQRERLKVSFQSVYGEERPRTEKKKPTLTWSLCNLQYETALLDTLCFWQQKYRANILQKKFCQNKNQKDAKIEKTEKWINENKISEYRECEN